MSARVRVCPYQGLLSLLGPTIPCQQVSHLQVCKARRLHIGIRFIKAPAG